VPEGRLQLNAPGELPVLEILSLMMVRPFTPMILIFFDTLTVLVHVKVPAGRVIVSPLWACLSWMDCMFVGEPSEL
jgi:hypothetical protein